MITFIYDDINKHLNLDRVIVDRNQLISACEILPTRTDAVCYPHIVDDIDIFINLLSSTNAQLTTDTTRHLINSFLSGLAIIILDDRIRDRHAEVYNVIESFLDRNYYACNRVFVIVPVGVDRTPKRNFISVNQNSGNSPFDLSQQVANLMAIKVNIATARDFANKYLADSNEEIHAQTIIGQAAYRHLNSENDNELTLPIELINHHALTPYGEEYDKNNDLIHNFADKVSNRIDYQELVHKDDSFYIWPIEIDALTFSNASWKPAADIVIPTEVLDDFNNGKVVFSFHQGAEGYIQRKQYEKFIINVLNRIGADSSKWNTHVMFFHGNAKNDITDTFPYYFCNLYFFVNWVSTIATQDQLSFVLSRKSKLYNFLSRRPRIYRTRFIAETLRRDLAHLCIFSLGDEDYDSTVMPYLSAAESVRISPWIGYSPDNIDPVNDNPVAMIDRQTFDNTLISVVGETHVIEEITFLSEKIFKPIAAGHPFMVYGNPNSLELLQSMGFRTFSRWWDESYDQENNYKKRMHMIHDELEKLASMSWDSLLRIRREMQPTVNYNRKRFVQILSERYSSLNVNQPLIEQWHKFAIERLIKDNKI